RTFKQLHIFNGICIKSRIKSKKVVHIVNCKTVKLCQHLVWRTSGEQRLSNFMLWQAAYSEMVFSDVLWPDVDRRHLWQAIETYAERNRRYGTA
ncbi:MAG TPA: undecaprenyl diphosphate synthase family protein, partial [Marmoricola sp.]|nr:undecaprenyl diphosphate synthase family protein [Marmoricola sp.]